MYTGKVSFSVCGLGFYLFGDFLFVVVAVLVLGFLGLFSLWNLSFFDFLHGHVSPSYCEELALLPTTSHRL